MKYRVVWEIDIEDAKTPLEAAQKALEIQRDPNSAATVFQVFENDKKLFKEIDLEEW
jgi:hypothetical protein